MRPGEILRGQFLVHLQTDSVDERRCQHEEPLRGNDEVNYQRSNLLLLLLPSDKYRWCIE